ncbi:TetR/AcrR family transcriptional regulator [uncultured Jatrophihabitans sp.]|uniref:TetR/AcrR family transcriptional regulator n=1 Tax=uncultured Jatrophihabitans sp. TaxID=1610747 RepID=UPI0035CBB986
MTEPDNDAAERTARVRMTGRQRREQLVQVGRSLFAERGYDATSIEEIAARAGVSKPVVYEHFGGKEGLYAVVVDREMSDLLSRLTRALSAGHPRELAEQSALALLTYIEERTDGFRILSRDSTAGSTGAFSSLLNDVASQVEHVLARQFDRRGYDPAHAAMYAQMLVGMVALTGMWWLEERAPDRATVAAHIVNLGWNGLAQLDSAPQPIAAKLD